MAFMNQSNDQIVKADGSSDAKIAIIGEAPGVEESREGKPFVGTSGRVLESCLHSAGLTRADVYITNVVKTQPYKNDITPYYTDTGGFTEKGWTCVKTLEEELSNINANVFVPLGNVALCALTDLKAITKYRGYIWKATRPAGKKVIPSIHPAFTVRGNYIHRYYITHDLYRARIESDSPLIKYTERRLVYKMTFAEAIDWIDYFGSQPSFAFDIEVIQYQVSCISFSSSPELAISIPLYGQWDEWQEIQLWKRIAKILEDPTIDKVLQNGIFDIWFLASQCNIFVRGKIRDTMIAHHIMYPDMLKSLGFLASIHTTDAYWKDMVNWKDPKKES